MAEEGINEFANLANVTFKGIEIVGSFSKSSMKAFIAAAKFLITSILWGKDRIKDGFRLAKDHQYHKSGKKSQKVMKDKYQGNVLYGKLENIKEKLKAQEIGNRNFTEEQLNRFPNDKWLQEKFAYLAKKHGLEYCILPNITAKKGDQQLALFFQYPKSQEHIFNEIHAELAEMIKKECQKVFEEIDKENEVVCKKEVKECEEKIKGKNQEIVAVKEQIKKHRKVGDKVSMEVCAERLGILEAELEKLRQLLETLMEKLRLVKKQTGKDLMESLSKESKEVVKGEVVKNITAMQYLEQSGLLEADEKVFDEEMLKTFPKEYPEIQKEEQMALAEKKEYSGLEAKEEARQRRNALVKRMNKQLRQDAQKDGKVIEVDVAVKKYGRTENSSRGFFIHPTYPAIVVNMSAKNICGVIDDSHVVRNDEGKAKKGRVNFALWRDEPLEFLVPVIDKNTGKIVFDETGKKRCVTITATWDEFEERVKDLGIEAAETKRKVKQEYLQQEAKGQIKKETAAEKKGEIKRAAKK